MTARQSLDRPPCHRHGAAEAGRFWSTLVAVIGLLLVMSGLPMAVRAADFGEQPASGHFPNWFKQSFLDLKQDLAEAGGAGKQGVMILFSIRGCAYCRMFIERSLGDPAIQAILRRRFDVIHLDIHSDLELKDPLGRSMPVKAFAAREGASFSPSVAFYGLDGLPLLRVVGYQTPERFRGTLDQVIVKLEEADSVPMVTKRAGRRRTD